MSEISIYLLGPFQAYIDHQTEVLEFRTEKERALLAYLAVEADRAHTRDALAELFWPDRPEGIARTNLRQALAGIRRSIGDRHAAAPFLDVTDETIRFNPDRPYWLDTVYFSKLIAGTKTHAHPRINGCPFCRDNLEEALIHYRNEFLSGTSIPKSHRFQEWTIFYREHFFRQLMVALDHLSDMYFESGDFDQAYTHAWRQVRLAPLEENAHRRLMKILAANGRRSAALEQYQNCKRVLRKELGIEPSPETIALFEEICRGPSVRQPLMRPQKEVIAWETPLTPFFGRKALLAQLATCMPDPTCRLLTIIGRAGVGKTRLAVQAINENRAAFADGVITVPVDLKKNGDSILPAFARALNLKNQSGSGLREKILEVLKPLHGLIYIDQYGPLIHQTEFLLDILKFAPGVKILLTSRRKLNYQAACLFKLDGLAYPDSDDTPNAIDFPAIRLFASRAERIRASFSVLESIPALIEICKVVEGLPLALELAAARLREYPCDEIAARIKENYGFLITPQGDLPPRHQSMPAAVEYSWDLLTPDEQQVYKKLAVFPGSFDIEAAVAVADANLSILASFVDQSLLTGNAARGFSFYPFIHEHAKSKLRHSSEEFAHVNAEYQKICRQDPTRDTEDPWLLAGPALKVPPADAPYSTSPAIAPLTIQGLGAGSSTSRATIDPLTDLPNRMVFEDRLDHALTLAVRHRFKIAVLILQVSRQPSTIGAPQNQPVDRLLPAIAARLRRLIRESDTVARVGAAEFGIILENIRGAEDAKVVAQKVASDLTTLFELAGRAQELGVNIGIGLFPTDGSDCIGLLRRTLLALQKAAASPELPYQFSTL